MRHEDLKKELLKDQKFSKAYFKNDPLFKFGRQIKEIRIAKGLTQGELAKKMGTKQSSIARIESGNGGKQTYDFLKRFADVVGVNINPPSFSDKSPITSFNPRENLSKFANLQSNGHETIFNLRGVDSTNKNVEYAYA